MIKLIFYTCPAKAIKYYDCSGILQHYDGYLNQMTENTNGYGFLMQMILKLSIC